MDTFTKTLATPYVPARNQILVRISSNLLEPHGFKTGTRVTKQPLPGGGAGFDIVLDESGEQQVYGRKYRSERRETVIEVADRQWTSRLLGAAKSQIVSRPGRIRVTAIPDRRVQIISKTRKTRGLPMFSILSSGICAHAFWQAGFEPSALCEWRPPEKRDIAANRDLTETGASTACSNVPFKTIFNQDIFSLTKPLLNECLPGPVSLIAGSLQCDAFSTLKSKAKKEQIRASGEPGDAELFYPVLKLVEETSPAVIFIENVPAFLNSEIGGSFKAILGRIGYYVTQTTLNGADFGTPCSRPRGFLVASVWPGFTFPTPPKSGRTTSSLRDFLGETLAGCRDITNSNTVARALAKNRLRAASLDGPTAPVFPKSQARVDDRVLFRDESCEPNRLLDPSIEAMRKIHGIPDSFDMSALPRDIQIEQIGQGVDYPLIRTLAAEIESHMSSNLNLLGLLDFTPPPKECSRR
jgi:DNA (cytosine-5)-methyltransferase 1